MAIDGDPYHVLGLPRGAPLAEVKRAYRRLAKEHHPDTAGEEAIALFLAIQAAYEALVGSDGRGRRRPGVARQAPWAADPDRAQATRDAWQRGGRRPAGAGPAGPASAGGGSDGPRTGTTDPAAGAAGDGERAGGFRRRRRAGHRPADARPGRPPGRATPGSTTYDAATDEPFDPEWSGASWYGQSSGTYWTINPKEYADPRKHGPEYQARGRRREAPLPGASPPGASPPGASPPGASPPGAEPEGRPFSDAGTPAPDADSGQPAAATDAVPGGTPGPTSWPRAPRPGPWPAGDATAPHQIGDRARPTTRTTASPAPTGPLREPALALPLRPTSRLGLALVGWPPIGLALAFLLGELSGCARFSASCVEPFSIGAWVAQVLVIAVLLLVPPLASVAALGTMAALAAAIPAAVVLSAAGGSREPAAAGAVLLTVLGAAWLVGVGLGLVRRSRTVPP